jgi:hypothetical protein
MRTLLLCAILFSSATSAVSVRNTSLNRRQQLGTGPFNGALGMDFGDSIDINACNIYGGDPAVSVDYAFFDPNLDPEEQDPICDLQVTITNTDPSSDQFGQSYLASIVDKCYGCSETQLGMT